MELEVSTFALIAQHAGVYERGCENLKDLNSEEKIIIKQPRDGPPSRGSRDGSAIRFASSSRLDPMHPGGTLQRERLHLDPSMLRCKLKCGLHLYGPAIGTIHCGNFRQQLLADTLVHEERIEPA